VLAVFKRGRPGQVYNVGTGETYNNITLVKMILSLVDRKEGLIEFVEDRKGHDFKYAIDCGKIANELGWAPEILFDDGIKQTIDWYKNYLDNILPC
jgi:dTDP-glucose 4,6-dehydratase